MKKTTIFKIALLLVAFSWGAGFPATKIALDSGMEPNAIMSIRFLIASACIFAFLLFRRVKITKKELKLGLISGIWLGIAFSFQTVGLKYTTPSKNAFLTGAYVVLVPFFLWALTKKRPKSIVYISSIICFIGIGFLSLDGNISIKYGDLLTLICAVFFALQIAVIGAYIKDMNPITINAFQMLSAGILTLGLNIGFENFSIINASITSTQAEAIAFLVVCNTLCAYLIQTAAQKYVASSTAALLLSGEIVFAGLISIMFFGDALTFKTILGGGLIFLSVILAENGFDFGKLLKNRIEE